MEGVVEALVQQIPPGRSLPPFKSSIDELCYVLSGHGTTTVWSNQNDKSHTFEWSPHSMFLLPRNAWHELSNMHGDRSVRLLHYNYAPLAMSAVGNPDFFFGNPFEEAPPTHDDFYSEAQSTTQEHIAEGQARRTLWVGNFFPDMAIWDNSWTGPAAAR